MIEALPGVSDILPEEAAAWRVLEQTAHTIFPRYGFGELRTPIFERTEVFMHSLGDETDIVKKEMYTFTDRGDRSLTLRPEGTAGVMRALANAGIGPGEEKRVYYLGPMFRGERPAAGRKRQFHQVGVECVGKATPALDVECLAMLMDYLGALGITQTKLLLNTRGSADDRQNLGELLRTYFAPHLSAMCADCQRRHTTNVWRMLDCKEAGCQPIITAAPDLSAALSEPTRAYFQAVRDGLDRLGVAYVVEPRLVRGLDYYAHTVFEVVFEGIGAQNSIAGGGRYEITVPGLAQPLLGVGFAAGMERLLLAREQLQVVTPKGLAMDLFLVSLGQAALARNMLLAKHLRATGVRVLMDLEGRGMKAQMRAADKSGAPLVLILGDNELARNIILCKDMTNATQSEWPLDFWANLQAPDLLATPRTAIEVIRHQMEAAQAHNTVQPSLSRPG